MFDSWKTENLPLGPTLGFRRWKAYQRLPRWRRALYVLTGNSYPWAS